MRLCCGRRSSGAELRRGVTLLELIAVVVIIGLVASVTAVGFGKSVVNAKRRQAIETFLFVDQQCRVLADRSNQAVTLQYDSRKQQLQRKLSEPGKWTLLATDVEIPDLWVAGAADDSNRILYHSTGHADTFAIVDHEGACHLIVGATGQVAVVSSLSSAKELVDGIKSTSRSIAD